MKINFVKGLLLAATLGVGLSSCSVATKTVEAEVATQTLLFEDIYEGGNEKSITLNVAEMLGDVDITKIEGATIQSILVSKKDSLGLSEINEAKVQLLGESEDLTMVTVGVSGEIKEGSQEIELSILDEVEIAKYLKEENVTLVLDLTYIKDQEVPQNYEVGIKFDLEMNEQK